MLSIKVLRLREDVCAVVYICTVDKVNKVKNPSCERYFIEILKATNFLFDTWEFRKFNLEFMSR